MTYLDWAAGAPRDPEIWREAQGIDNESFANPSSRHELGRQARHRLEEARERAAIALGVEPHEVVFTSGASEANNLIISSLLLRETRGNVVLSGVEHASIHEPCMLLHRMGFSVRIVAPDRAGRIDPDAVLRKIDSATVMLAIMHVNNETGAIEPIEDIVRLVRSNRAGGRRVHIHTDLVQSFGRTTPVLPHVDVDSAAISGHKLGAPRGSGVLVVRKKLDPIYRGGGHEGGKRPGTQDLFAIWGTMRSANVPISRSSPHRLLPPGASGRFSRRTSSAARSLRCPARYSSG